MYQPSINGIQRVLCLGCHADDIEIGCGGTLLRLIQEVPNLEICWVVLSAEGVRKEEATRSAERWLANTSECEIIIGDFRDRYFPSQWTDIKDFIHDLAGRFAPDLVFTQRRDDAHQDHRLVGELTWNAFRNHMILEYEIPKYEGDLGQPNIFFRLEKSTCQQKVDYLREEFSSQQSKPWYSPDTFWATLRLRGLECNSPSLYAEGFYSRKLAL